MESKEKFGQFISQKRKEQQLTQKDFAARLYVTESAVSKWERGLSYPDISLVTDICRELNVSEHELITASEDYRQRNIEKQARSFNNIVKTYSWIFYSAYAISLLSCFIVNIAVFYTLSWFFIVLAAEITAFTILNLPVIMENKKSVAVIIGSFVSIIVLLMTCCIYVNGDWFWVSSISVTLGYSILFLPILLKEIMKPIGIGNHKALICGIVDTLLIVATAIIACTYAEVSVSNINSILLPLLGIGLGIFWFYLVIIRYVSVNTTCKTVICLLTAGAIEFWGSCFIDAIASKEKLSLPKVDMTLWNSKYVDGNIRLTILLSAILVSVVLVVCKTIRTKEK